MLLKSGKPKSRTDNSILPHRGTDATAVCYHAAMLTRRSFAQLITAALALPANALAQADNYLGASQFSVMMWALNKQGTFEQNLERVAQAGYRHIQLVDEFKHWSDEDKRRILARMKSLGISVDATAGMTTGFANPTGSEAFLADLKALIPIAHQLQCNQIILLSGKRIEGSSSQHEASIATLRQSAEILHAENIVGVIEPIDRLENPTIYLDGVTEAFEMTKAIASQTSRSSTTSTTSKEASET
jgi:hydroxypyruvate isomerase